MHTWAIIILLILASRVEARELPSEVDLRAAYCIPYVQQFINAVGPPETFVQDPEVKEAAEQLLSQLTSDLRRLQLYLMPRIRHLDSLGLTTALQRGKEDVGKMYEYSKTYSTKCDRPQHKPSQDSCFKKCMADSPFKTRLESCSDLRWLPF
jgi:signal transduction histidine kinase